jgi:hypothetical protein
MANSISEIRHLLPAITRKLINKPNVVATGIGYKKVQGKKTEDLCIICSVETKVPASGLSKKELITGMIEGIPTDVHPVGYVHPMQSPTDRFRPAPGGVSIGHILITAGTLGCLVKKESKQYILSNNHVLANTNNAVIGDMIIQPGRHDGGVTPGDQIAKLSQFVPILFENEKQGCRLSKGLTGIYNFLAKLSGSSSRLYSGNAFPSTNLVDCAIAEPLGQGEVNREILGVGGITGIAEGSLEMIIKKSGRTTGLTKGIIEQTDATVRVNFGAGKTALFTDQLIAGAMSQGGDSGSVVLTEENELIGLLFAGSINTTIINRIQNVFSKLDIEPA